MGSEEDDFWLDPIVEERAPGEAVSPQELWAASGVREVLRDFLEYWSGYDFPAARREADLLKLLQQVEALWAVPAVKGEYSHRPLFASLHRAAGRVPCKVLFLLAVPGRPEMGMREGDGADHFNERTGSHGLREALCSDERGLEEQEIAACTAFPWPPGERWGRRQDGTDTIRVPPQVVARVWLMYVRVLVRVLRPAWLVVYNGDGAAVLGQLRQVLQMAPSQLRGYAFGENDFRGQEISTVSMDRLATHERAPLLVKGHKGKGGFKADSVRLMHPFWLGKQSGPKGEEARVAQKALLDAIAQSTQPSSRDRAAVNAFDLLMPGRAAPAGEVGPPAQRPRQAYECVALFGGRLVLAGMPLDLPQQAELVVKRGCRRVVNMGSARVRFPKTREYRADGGVYQSYVEKDRFQTPDQRWTPEQLEALVDEVLRFWEEGHRVAAVCDSGVQENWLLAAAVWLALRPHLQPVNAGMWLLRHRDSPIPFRDALAEALDAYWRVAILPNYEAFAGEYADPVWRHAIRLVRLDPEGDPGADALSPVALSARIAPLPRQVHQALWFFPSRYRARLFLDWVMPALRQVYTDAFCYYVCTNPDGYYVPAVRGTTDIPPRADFYVPRGEDEVAAAIAAVPKLNLEPLLVAWGQGSYASLLRPARLLPEHLTDAEFGDIYAACTRDE